MVTLIYFYSVFFSAVVLHVLCDQYSCFCNASTRYFNVSQK